jgi:transposase
MDTIIQPSARSANRSHYRRHTIDFKRAVVQQSLVSGASVSVIAREHDINANQVFAWRKAFKEGRLDTASSDGCKLLAVTLARSGRASTPTRSREAVAAPTGVIQLEAGNAQLRIEGVVDAAILALVLERFLR